MKADECRDRCRSRKKDDHREKRKWVSLWMIFGTGTLSGVTCFSLPSSFGQVKRNSAIVPSPMLDRVGPYDLFRSSRGRNILLRLSWDDDCVMEGDECVYGDYLQDGKERQYSGVKFDPLPPLTKEFYEDDYKVDKFGGDVDETVSWDEGEEESTDEDGKESDDTDDEEDEEDTDDVSALTQRRIEEQQSQIDLLMKIVQDSQTKQQQQQAEIMNQNSSLRRGEPSRTAVAPLKAMLFIDGTWLYYSIHQRRAGECPIIAKFGNAWQHYNKIDWPALPRVICEQLQNQKLLQNWQSSYDTTDLASDGGGDRTPGAQIRPIEIVRATVFTSYKRHTDKNSIRVRMFEEMKDSNYDVHTMETLGQGEKCVDIQLAVEMMHYATVPQAYDVGILLSGDKDFMPALIRTRQKGKQVAIVSMRAGCNRALYQSPHLKDYDVVWIDDFLDKIVVPLGQGDIPPKVSGGGDALSAVLILTVVYDFVKAVVVDVPNSAEGVSSRDIGRYLKTIKVTGSKTILQQLKDVYGGLRRFLAQYGSEVFVLLDRDEKERKKRDKRDRSYWVDIIDDSGTILAAEIKSSKFTSREKEFLESYKKNRLLQQEDNFADMYFHTFEDPNAGNSFYTPRQANNYGGTGSPPSNDTSSPSSNGPTTPAVKESKTLLEEQQPDLTHLPPDLTVDYEQWTGAMLKERCRERKLPVSGAKNILLARVTKDAKQLMDELKQTSKEQKLSIPQPQQRPNNPNQSRSTGPSSRKVIDPNVTGHLEDLVKEYLLARGNTAGSRDVGRYLSANAAYRTREESALKELKDNYGTLAQFFSRRQEVFLKEKMNPVRYGTEYGFPIHLKK